VYRRFPPRPDPDAIVVAILALILFVIALRRL
jgi:hypothetical protein